MKISRARRLGRTSALLGAAKEPVDTSVTQEPHRHPKNCSALESTNIRLLIEEAPPGGGLIFTSVLRSRILRSPYPGYCIEPRHQLTNSLQGPTTRNLRTQGLVAVDKHANK